jgi:hypothetical protein
MLETAANAVTRPFECRENEVQQVLAVMERDTGWLLNYRQLLCNPKYKKAWNLLAENKFGWLAQGVGDRIKGTNTIKFIHKRKVPKSRLKDVTYGQFVCTEWPEKAEPNRTRFTVEGDQINYPGKVATPTADLLVAKNPVQQHNINAWGKIHDSGYLKLLPQLAVSPPGVHSNQNKQHPRGDYQWIQPTQ